MVSGGSTDSTRSGLRPATHFAATTAPCAKVALLWVNGDKKNNWKIQAGNDKGSVMTGEQLASSASIEGQYDQQINFTFANGELTPILERSILTYRGAEYLPWDGKLKDGEALREKYGKDVDFHYYPSEDMGIFWSNNPAIPIDAMVKWLGIQTNDEYVARATKMYQEYRQKQAAK